MADSDGRLEQLRAAVARLDAEIAEREQQREDAADALEAEEELALAQKRVADLRQALTA